MKTYRNPNNVHKPLAAYIHQIEITSERMLIMSGQIGMLKDGSISDDPIEQLKVTLENIRKNLNAANMTINDIVKLTIYIVGEMEPNERRRILADYFKEIEPCMTLLFVVALGTPSIKVEIEATASSE